MITTKNHIIGMMGIASNIKVVVTVQIFKYNEIKNSETNSSITLKGLKYVLENGKQRNVIDINFEGIDVIAQEINTDVKLLDNMILKIALK